MTLETLVVGLVALLIGAGLVVAGYRFFLILLPIFGFVAGFYVGSAAVTALFGDGFLSTVTGWVVGLVGGVAFGLLAYFFFIIDVIILCGAVGAALGAALMNAIGLGGGILEFIVAAGAAIVLAIAGVLLAVPKYLVIVLTAVIGAATAVAGVLLIFGTIKLSDLEQGPVDAIVKQSTLWILVFVVVAIAGILAQVRSTPTYVLDPEGARFG